MSDKGRYIIHHENTRIWTEDILSDVQAKRITIAAGIQSDKRLSKYRNATVSLWAEFTQFHHLKEGLSSSRRGLMQDRTVHFQLFVFNLSQHFIDVRRFILSCAFNVVIGICPSISITERLIFHIIINSLSSGRKIYWSVPPCSVASISIYKMYLATIRLLPTMAICSSAPIVAVTGLSKTHKCWVACNAPAMQNVFCLFLYSSVLFWPQR